MVPATVLAIPTVRRGVHPRTTDTTWAVILPSMLNPFAVYLMRVYTDDAIPDEVLDAARVDGAGEVSNLLHGRLPLMRPAIITVLLWAVVGTSNNYFLPLVMLSTPTCTDHGRAGALRAQSPTQHGGGHSLWNLIIAGALMSIIPLIIAFLTLQKYWQGGLSLGSVK